MQKEIILDNISYILKGIRYLYGYRQVDLANKLNVGQGSIQRWEKGLVKPNRGYNKIKKLLNSISYNTEELISYGRIDPKKLIEEIRALLRLSYRKCAKLLDLCPATITHILREEIRLNPGTMNKIINGYLNIKNTEDKRNLFIKLAKPHELKIIKKYKKIIGVNNENNQGKAFEERIIRLVVNAGFKVIKNPILADKDLRIQKCIDIYAIKGNIELCIECKDPSKTQIKNKIGKYVSGLCELRDICDNVFLFINGRIKHPEIGINKGIVILDKNNINQLNKNPKLLFDLINKERRIVKLPDEIRCKGDITLLKIVSKLSPEQLSILLGFNKNHIFRIERGERRLTKKTKYLLNKVLKEIKREGVRKIHFKANKLKFLARTNNKLIDKWNKAGLFSKIINFWLLNHANQDFEKNISKILNDLGYTTFENVILANKELSDIYEIDVYAIKDNKELAIECKKKVKIFQRYPLIREMKYKSQKLGINNMILVSKEKIVNKNKFLDNGIKVFDNIGKFKNSLKS